MFDNIDCRRRYYNILIFLQMFPLATLCLIEFHAINRQSYSLITCYSHRGRVTQICVSELVHHWFRKWRLIINWNLKNKFQWNFRQNTTVFIQWNWFWYIICKMAFCSGLKPQYIPNMLGKCTQQSGYWSTCICWKIRVTKNLKYWATIVTTRMIISWLEIK